MDEKKTSLRESMPPMEFICSASSKSKIPDDLPQICFAGRSNSGKSSLISALCSNPSIVKTSSKPGHTRVLNVFRRLDFYLIDMPGYGYAQMSKAGRDTLSQMIAEYLTDNSSIRAGFLLLDCNRKPEQEEYFIQDLFLQKRIPLHLLLTKVDRLNQKERSKLEKDSRKMEGDFTHILQVSATKGIHLDYLSNFLKTL